MSEDISTDDVQNNADAQNSSIEEYQDAVTEQEAAANDEPDVENLEQANESHEEEEGQNAEEGEEPQDDDLSRKENLESKEISGHPDTETGGEDTDAGALLSNLPISDEDVLASQTHEPQVGELIADIFGESEDEEEFEGFNKDEDEALFGQKNLQASDVIRRDVNLNQPDAEVGEDAEYNSDDEDIKPVVNRRVVENEDSSNEQDVAKGAEATEREEGAPADEAEKGAATQEEAAEEESGEPVVKPDESSDDSGDEESPRKTKLPEDFVYDFDIMMAKKKEGIRRRRRKNIDIINDSDDMIAELIRDMREAADDDFNLNKNHKPAPRKLKLLPVVASQLRKIDLREAFLESDVLKVMTDWLTPLPDRSLPNLQVRETLFRLLTEFNLLDVERIKASGIGKAVMYLFKHPKETKENKKMARNLISMWSRPIFNLETDFHSISKEEREIRDQEQLERRKRRISAPEEQRAPKAMKDDAKLRPNEKGFVSRARVPMVSTRDYLVRPSSTVDVDMSRSSKKSVSRLDKHLRSFSEKKKQLKTQRAVKISIEGRKMSF